MKYTVQIRQYQGNNPDGYEVWEEGVGMIEDGYETEQDAQERCDELNRAKGE